MSAAGERGARPRRQCSAQPAPRTAAVNMKPVTIFITFLVIYFSYSRGCARAVYEDKHQYEKMTFDLVLRGSWMLNQCARTLLNCYEIVRGDLMCANEKYFSSACAVQRNWCHNENGQTDYPKPVFYELYEELCSDSTYEYWTRRAAGAHLRLL